MNLILDTNAFLYFYKISKGISTPDKWNGSNFDQDEYLMSCISSNKIFITGETLHELLLQSLRNDNTANQFISQYNFILEIHKNNSEKVAFLNSTNGMKFDIKHFSKLISRNSNYDEFLNIKIQEEKKIMDTFIKVLLSAICNVLHRINGDTIIKNRYEYQIDSALNYIDNCILNLYKKCYIKREIDNSQFETNLDKAFKKVISFLLNEINNQTCILGGDKVFFDELYSKEELGVNYVSKIFNKLKSKSKENTREIFKSELKEILELLKSNNTISYHEAQFIYYILEKYGMYGRSIKKNDMIDYLIITTLESNVNIKIANDVHFEDGQNPDKNNTCLITFDKTLHEFSKNNNWLYRDYVYKEFLIEI